MCRTNRHASYDRNHYVFRGLSVFRHKQTPLTSSGSQYDTFTHEKGENDNTDYLQDQSDTKLCLHFFITAARHIFSLCGSDLKITKLTCFELKAIELVSGEW